MPIQLVVDVKRLANDLRELKKTLRRTYRNPKRQVTASDLRASTSSLAESWFSDISLRVGNTRLISADYLSNLNVHFQRLLLYAERATLRKLYDKEIEDILGNYTANLVVPLMAGHNEEQPEAAANLRRALPEAETAQFEATAFVGHSFNERDRSVNETFIGVLQAIGIKVATGEKPQAGEISAKVKQRIEDQHFFVGIFTKRDRIAKKKAWTTSAWVIEEKAYAHGQNKRLILLKEAEVESIAGIQGTDYEYIEFSRHNLQDAVVKMLQLFAISVSGMAPK